MATTRARKDWPEAKPAGRGMELTPSGPWVNPIALVRTTVKICLERDGHHRKIVAAQSQRHEAKPGAGGESDSDPSQEAEPEREVIVDRAESHGIGAERKKRSLREIDLAA